MPKFKVGQEVYIKQWLDMPPEVKENWSCVTMWYKVGEKGVIEKCLEKTHGEFTYYILFPGGKNTQFVFEKELEPVIGVGQLLFPFMSEGL